MLLFRLTVWSQSLMQTTWGYWYESSCSTSDPKTKFNSKQIHLGKRASTCWITTKALMQEKQLIHPANWDISVTPEKFFRGLYWRWVSCGICYTQTCFSNLVLWVCECVLSEWNYFAFLRQSKFDCMWTCSDNNHSCFHRCTQTVHTCCNEAKWCSMCSQNRDSMKLKFSWQIMSVHSSVISP